MHIPIRPGARSTIRQDLVPLLGSTLSIVFLAPTLRDSDARVPLATSVPSMAIGLVYSTTFTTLGMNFWAVGSFAAGVMWFLIGLLRSPPRPSTVSTLRDRVGPFADDVHRWSRRKLARQGAVGRYV